VLSIPKHNGKSGTAYSKSISYHMCYALLVSNNSYTYEYDQNKMIRYLDIVYKSFKFMSHKLSNLKFLKTR